MLWKSEYIQMTNLKFSLVVAGAFMLGVALFTPKRPPPTPAEQAQQQQQPKAQAQPKAQEQAQASDPFAGKPWRQWSEDEMTEFMRRALIACVKKADPKQEHDCYGVVNTIADDWKAHHG
jgi:hypothetical protein